MSLKPKPKAQKPDLKAIEDFASKAPNVSPKDTQTTGATERKIFSLQTDDVNRIDQQMDRAFSLNAGDKKALSKDSYMVRVALRALQNCDNGAFRLAVEQTRVISPGRRKS